MRAFTSMLLVALGGCVTEPHAAATCASCLSSQGLYTDIATGRIAPGAIEFTPAFEAWSDGASKRRWLILPPGATIDASDLDHWRFPIGTKVFKEFSLDGRRLETRMIETVADTGDAVADHRFAAYVWRADDGDADLAPAEGAQDVLGTDHDVPSQSDCVFCHHSEPGAALGLSAVQQSGTASPGLLARPLADVLAPRPTRTYPIPGDPTTSAALGFLHANCGHCHTDGGSCPAPQLRLFAADASRDPRDTLTYATTVDVAIADWPTHPPDITLRIAPGDPDHSGVFYRMSSRGTDQMPPIATEIVPDTGVAALRAWIATMQ